jgi:tetratricopeptide (TPR) repeat protein
LLTGALHNRARVHGMLEQDRLARTDIGSAIESLGSETDKDGPAKVHDRARLAEVLILRSVSNLRQRDAVAAEIDADQAVRLLLPDGLDTAARGLTIDETDIAARALAQLGRARGAHCHFQDAYRHADTALRLHLELRERLGAAYPNPMLAELARTYGDRARALFGLKRFAEAVVDVNAAIELGETARQAADLQFDSHEAEQIGGFYALRGILELIRSDPGAEADLDRRGSIALTTDNPRVEADFDRARALGFDLNMLLTMTGQPDAPGGS